MRFYYRFDLSNGDFSSDGLLPPGQDFVETEANEQGRADDAEVVQEKNPILDLPEVHRDPPESHEQDDGNNQVFEMQRIFLRAHWNNSARLELGPKPV
jgi:hypothetical protein